MRILLIEDEMEMAAWLIRALKQSSIAVEHAPNGKLGKALLAGKGAVQQDTDGDGKPDKVLGDEDRANQRNLADAAVKAYCPPAVTAGR